MANGYSFENTQRELSNEYQHARVSMIFKRICILVLWTKVALALEGFRGTGSDTDIVSESAVSYCFIPLGFSYM